MASTLVPRVLRASTVVAARVATLPADRARVVEAAGASLAQLALALDGDEQRIDTAALTRLLDVARIDEARIDEAPAPDVALADVGLAGDASTRETRTAQALAVASSSLRRVRLLRAPTARVPEPPASAPWVSPGRIVELCSGPDSAQTSAAVVVLRDAQREGDPVAWIMPRGAGLFPPDLAAAGIDLDALVVVHVPPDDAAAAPRAAELVLRTGAFGAVVLDLGSAVLPRGTAWQGRLLGLAREHACRVVVLSPHGRSRASLGPLVSLRFDVRRKRVGPDRFGVVASALKDKSGLLATHETRGACLAPVGAR
ncbi:hypothetical protein [Sandaracinus amylolyticus]|uniref:hypothetical protein n=1 Tax=Sandaracinus amylolyticus TaxID=927083 RepID=UPI00069F9320|nr:hypothetical protein [Sandaracinus amylolyticus]